MAAPKKTNKEADKAANEMVGSDAPSAEDAAVAARVAEHDNSADKELVAQLTATDVDPADLLREIEELKAELAAKDSKGASKSSGKGSANETFWLADPRSNMRLFNPETNDYIKFRNGRYTAQTKQEVELIEKHLASIAFKEDRKNARKPHPVTGYAPLSDAAYDAHVELVSRP